LQGWQCPTIRIFWTTDDENSRYSESWPLRQYQALRAESL
jgi:hypothetical protein